MADNVLMHVKQKISAATDIKRVEEILCETFDGIDSIYSYLIYVDYDANPLQYTIQYNISQNEELNTLTLEDVLTGVIHTLETVDLTERKKIIGYGQPSIEIVLETYDPLVHKLARYQKNRWKTYDYDDLCQICRFVMIKLYRKGYYIHRRLLQRSFENEIWMDVKKHKGDHLVVSFEDTFYQPAGNSSEELLFADIVPDKELIEQEEEEDREEVNKLIFEEVKAIVIEHIGPRQWDELMRDYGNNHTTSWSRKALQRVKKHLEQLGISRKDFYNKYYG